MSDEALWWIALGAGLVVAVVATALLEILARKVDRIERAAAAVWLTGKQLAGNTATTWMLEVTAERLDTLAAEVDRHAALLDTGNGG